LDKTEVIAVLHEILHEYRDSLTITSVSLDRHKPNIEKSDDEYIIRIRGDLNKNSFASIKNVLEDRKLMVEETNGAIIIRSRDSKDSYELTAN
jgi:hypothetical protein